MMKMDLHCHSEASYDCITAIADFPDRCLANSISVQAITDHNEIWGAQELKKLVDKRNGQKHNSQLTIIVGEEISTNEGEIIGLFLNKKIERDLSPEETVKQIRAQGGLVLLPHGFDPLKRWRLTPEARARIADSIDIVESFNARISLPMWNRKARSWAQQRHLPISAGTDAHTLADVGTAWVDAPMRPIESPQDLLTALNRGTPQGNWTHPVFAFVYKVWDYINYRLGS